MDFDPVTDYQRRNHERKRRRKKSHGTIRQKRIEVEEKTKIQKNIVVCPICMGRGVSRDPKRVGGMPCHNCQGQGWVDKKKDYCFIATAVYGSPLAPEIDWLRIWRDDVLIKNILGRRFIKYYYLYSPRLAVVVTKSSRLRAICRILIAPIIITFKLLYSGNN